MNALQSTVIDCFFYGPAVEVEIAEPTATATVEKSLFDPQNIRLIDLPDCPEHNGGGKTTTPMYLVLYRSAQGKEEVYGVGSDRTIEGIRQLWLRPLMKDGSRMQKYGKYRKGFTVPAFGLAFKGGQVLGQVAV